MTEPRKVQDPVDGYRVFNVIAGRLWSYSAGCEWTPEENIARCDKAGKPTRRKAWVNDPDGDGLVETTITEGHGRIPALGCGCGFWFYKSEWACREKFDHLWRPPLSSGGGPFGNFGDDPVERVVMGKVEGRGRTIVGVDGYRSEFAKILALVTDMPEHFAEALEAYGLEAVRRRTKAEEGISEGWLGKYDPTARPLVMRTYAMDEDEDEEGEFLVEPGSPAHRQLLRLPPGALVRFRFDRQQGTRWVSTITKLDEEE